MTYTHTDAEFTADTITRTPDHVDGLNIGTVLILTRPDLNDADAWEALAAEALIVAVNIRRRLAGAE